MAKKILGKFIIEIGGKPKENVEKALNLVLNKLKEEKDLFKVVEIELEEPTYDEKTTLYGGFIEAEIKFTDILELIYFIQDYLPTSVEIIEPSEMTLTSHNLTETMNTLSHTILKHHEVIRSLNAQVHFLTKEKEQNKTNS